MIADADLDDAIRHAEQTLADLRRARAERRDRDFVLALARVIPPGVCFSAAELLAHAALDRELAAAIGPVTAKAVGHRLARVAARPVAGGPILQCVTRTNRSGRIWQIVLAP